MQIKKSQKDLEVIMLSDVCQTDKDKCHMTSLIFKSKEQKKQSKQKQTQIQRTKW